jgi:hypothetical protein
MAKVIESGDSITLQLSFWEKLGAFHGSITVPQSSLTKTYEVQNPWDRNQVMTGYRAPGTGIPMVIMLGTLRSKGFRDFCAVYGRGPATVFEFEGQPFRRWIVTSPELFCLPTNSV